MTAETTATASRSRRRGPGASRGLALAVGLAAAACGGGEPAGGSGGAADAAALAALPVPAEHEAGAAAFARSCEGCHGAAALGTAQGPPLVHAVYRPAHHADAAFLLAVRRGVRAHHWGFGDMAPVDGVTDAEARRITAYVRWLQREAGIE